MKKLLIIALLLFGIRGYSQLQLVNTGTGADAFTSTVSPLVKSTTYHVRSYATNSAGTSYGQDIEFTTPAFSIFGNGSTLIFVNGTPIKIE